MNLQLKPFPAILSLMLCVMMIETTTCLAQSGSEIYRHVTSRDGLSNSFVWEMIQDQHGYIWIAGNNGLDRYNGYDTVTFRNDANDETSISTGAVFSLLEDDAGYIWVGTGFGLSIFNPASESFLQVRLPEEYSALQGVRSIIQDDDGYIWTGSLSGLHRFSAQTPQADIPKVEFFEFDESFEPKPFVQTVGKRSNGMMLVGTDQGLFKLNIETGEFTKSGSVNEALDGVLSTAIWKLLKDRNNNIWITSETGFAVWREGENNPEHVTTIGNGEFDLTGAYMQSLFEDQNGYIWIGTGEIGAFKYNPETDEAVQFLHDSGNQNSITEDDVHYVFEDIDGNVWFGYHNIGISVMYTQPWEYQFTHLTETDNPTHPLNDIHQVVDDEEGNLWMATHQGLVVVPVDGSPLRSFLPDPQNTSPENVENQLAGFLFEGDRFLAGTHANKFYDFDIETERFTQIEIPEGVQTSFANIGNETHYLLGSLGGNELIEVSKEDFSVTVLEAPRREPDNSDNRGVLPIISPEGNIYIKYVYLETQSFYWDYFYFDHQNQTFTKLDLQSPDGISVFNPPVSSKNEEGVFWLNTNMGILREDVINNESRFLFQRDTGIIVDSGGEILEDDDGYLWLGGATGVLKLDPATETLTIFEANSDRKPSFFRMPTELSNGDITYSGIGGYTRFNPEQQVVGPTIQKVHVTELRSGADTYSTFRSNDTYEIEHSSNNIAFTYLALNYRNPATTRYRYRLIGYNDDWVEVGTQRSVFLANLPPGNYRFQVQAGQRFGSFSDTTAELNLAILPPWWRTIPAYLFFALILAGSVFTVDRVQRRRVISKEREMAREKELAQAKEIEKAYEHLKAAQDQLVQQEKLASLGQLTAGIAHEIKNPLNFVNNFSEVSREMIHELREEITELLTDLGAKNKNRNVTAKQKRSAELILELLDEIESNQNKIHEHGTRADGIVKSMLQHSRGGSGKMKPTDLNALIKEYINLAFHGMRAGKDPINVDIDLQLDDSAGEVPLIAEDFSRVILNLCNNAFDAMREKSQKSMVDGRKPPFEEGAEVPNAFGTEVGDVAASNYSPKLTVRTHQTEKSVTIEIEDNGPGIPDDLKDKILQPFFTTKKGTQGTGLGLSITNDIIKAHGGVLSIQSKKNEFVRFTIQLAVQPKAKD